MERRGGRDARQVHAGAALKTRLEMSCCSEQWSPGGRKGQHIIPKLIQLNRKNRAAGAASPRSRLCPASADPGLETKAPHSRRRRRRKPKAQRSVQPFGRARFMYCVLIFHVVWIKSNVFHHVYRLARVRYAKKTALGGALQRRKQEVKPAHDGADIKNRKLYFLHIF